MSFRKEIREKLAKLEGKMDQLISFYGTMKDLEEQNERLFDKLMTRNWEEYGATPTVLNREEERPFVEKPFSVLQDESIVGEVLSKEEIEK